MKSLPSKQDSYPWGPESTPYEAVGEQEGLWTLVEAFYDRIDSESPDLRAMLPREDSGSRRKLFEYLTGWLGGPKLYEARYGHPRLRMRHLPFSIGQAEAVEWMRCMRLAMDDAGLRPNVKSFLDSKLEPLALHMVNR